MTLIEFMHAHADGVGITVVMIVGLICGTIVILKLN
jgi:hypothetical protein